jgi:predicted TPR repeat methyltransferase
MKLHREESEEGVRETREVMRKYEPEGHGNGAQILSSGRFAHSHSYILSLGEKYGFCVRHIEEIIVRTEVSVPLPGKIYVFQRGS